MVVGQFETDLALYTALPTGLLLFGISPDLEGIAPSGDRGKDPAQIGAGGRRSLLLFGRAQRLSPCSMVVQPGPAVP